MVGTWSLYEDSELDFLDNKYADSIIDPKYNPNSTTPKGTI